MVIRNNSLDFLRASAIILVASVHVSQRFVPVLPFDKPYPVINGAIGVQLFFIISGYTMMLTFGNSVTWQRTISFYVRRFFRIAPLFWLAAAAYLLKDGLSPNYFAPNGVTWTDVLLTISFLHWISPSAFNSVVPGGWSIAVEMLFYSIFPIFAYLFIRKQFRIAPYALVLLVYVFGGLIAKSFLIPYISAGLPTKYQYLADAFVLFWLPNQLIAFGFGFILYQIMEQKTYPIVGILLLSATAITSSDGCTVFCLFLFAHFVLRANFENRLMSAIGTASYSIYLLHFMIIYMVSFVAKKLGVNLPSELAFIVVLALSLCIALFVTKPLIEDPFISLGRRWAGKFPSILPKPAPVQPTSVGG